MALRAPPKSAFQRKQKGTRKGSKNIQQFVICRGSTSLRTGTKWFGYKRGLDSRYWVPSKDEEKPIGAGAYGIVRRAMDKVNGNEFALKTIPKLPRKENAPVAPYQDKVKNEVSIMRHIGPSLNIVYLYDVFEDEDYVHMVMEYMKGGALWKKICEGNHSERQAAEMMQCILRTVAQCHARNVVYRDVKPENFLYASTTGGAPLKATDFGLATYFTPGHNLTRLCGTPSYMAPEVINKNYGPEADVWSAGVIAHQLLTGSLPFRRQSDAKLSAQDIMKAIQTREVDFKREYWEGVSEEAREFVSQLLVKDAGDRPLAAEALEHPWLKEADQRATTQPLDGSVIRRLQRYATAGLLKRSILRVLVEHVPDAVAKEVTEFQSLFDAFDKRQRGALTLNELSQGLQEAGYRITEEEAGQLMAALDTDRSGSVEAPEFVAALIDWHELQRVEGKTFTEWVLAAFDLIDTDRNGLVDAIDVDKMIGGVPPGYSVHDILREADQDGDGKIDREEFLYLVESSNEEDNLGAYDARLDSDSE